MSYIEHHHRFFDSNDCGICLFDTLVRVFAKKVLIINLSFSWVIVSVLT